MASKSKRRGRVFRASCILAALIIAGSSFAWFTSKDEVTNRLSATADYGVSIVEDFAPPKNWLPGQQINKDVSVVNTGNVDAFVRTWIDGEMSLVKKSAYADSTTALSGTATITDFSAGLNKTADTQTKLTGVNLNWYKGTNYYKELSQIKSENPLNSTTSTTAADEETNQPGRFSEVQSVQAGGVLVYHDVATTNPDTTQSAEYYYVLEQATTVEGYEYDTTNSTFSTTKTTKTYPKGTYVCTAVSCVATNNAITNKVKIDYNYYGNIDTSQFFPETEGLYLFRRNVKLTGASNAVDDYEYTGYYFLKDTNKYTTTATEKTDDKSLLDKRDRDAYNPVYLALAYDDQHGQRSDYVLPDSAVTTNTSDPTKDEFMPVTLSDVKLCTATEKVLKSYVGSGAKTYTVNGTEVTVSDTPTSLSSVSYPYSVMYNGDKYVSAQTATVKAGTYSKVNSTGDGVTSDQITVVETADEGLTWTFDGTDVLTATYGTGQDQIKINVKLANLTTSAASGASDAEKWTVIEDSTNNNKWTFYYNNDVEEGATTTKLIDYVELDESVKDEAYLAFDFDLNVFMESAQVVLDQDGNEKTDSIVTPWGNPSTNETNANTNYTAATGTKGGSSAEIEYITWATT